MQKIKRLTKGSCIGLICPAGPARTQEEIYKYTTSLENRGFKVKIGKTCFLKNGYLAGSDEERAADLMNMFLDEEVDAIFCYKGGYGCQRLLPFTDLNVIKNHPKLFLGFSDITVFLNVFSKFCDFPTLHSPMGLTLNKLDVESQNLFYDILCHSFTNSLKNTKNEPYIINEGRCEGKLVGGNLSLIYALMGTPYEIDLENNILLMEDVDENPYAIDRMLSSLFLSGKLSKVKGIICGTFTRCEASEGPTVKDVLTHYLAPLKIPVIAFFEVGHSFPNMSLPIGIQVRLDTIDKSVTVIEEMFLN